MKLSIDSKRMIEQHCLDDEPVVLSICSTVLRRYTRIAFYAMERTIRRNIRVLSRNRRCSTQMLQSAALIEKQRVTMSRALRVPRNLNHILLDKPDRSKRQGAL